MLNSAASYIFATERLNNSVRVKSPCNFFPVSFRGILCNLPLCSFKQRHSFQVVLRWNTRVYTHIRNAASKGVGIFITNLSAPSAGVRRGILLYSTITGRNPGGRFISTLFQFSSRCERVSSFYRVTFAWRGWKIKGRRAEGAKYQAEISGKI